MSLPAGLTSPAVDSPAESAAPLFLVASLSLLWTQDPNSTISSVLYAPMALQEMVLALWLILKGFNSTALAEPPPIATVH